ncbi:acetyltransferase [Carnobacteriaceae bacterium zg-ZUI240]|nr:acetyltransferase [Carnobacteriaceae bacterium zg-ZUI240]
MKSKVAFIGAGGHADAVLPMLNRQQYEFVGFFDDKDIIEHSGYPILGKMKDVESYLETKKIDAVFITIGDNDKRKEIFDGLKDRYYDAFINIISECSSILTPDISIQGRGVFVGFGAFIGSKVKINDNTVVNTGALIEHHTEISSHCNIAPNATINGSCHLGEQVYVGSGSIIIQVKNICDQVTIGAGAVVVNHITEKGTYVGVPAKKIIKE